MRWKIVLQTVISTHSHWKLRVVAPVARQPTSEGEPKTIVAGPDSSQAGHHQPEANSLAVVWWSSHPVNCRRIYHQEQLHSSHQWQATSSSAHHRSANHDSEICWPAAFHPSSLADGIRYSGFCCLRSEWGWILVAMKSGSLKKKKKIFYWVLLILHLLLPVCPRATLCG